MGRGLPEDNDGTDYSIRPLLWYFRPRIAQQHRRDKAPRPVALMELPASPSGVDGGSPAGASGAHGRAHGPISQTAVGTGQSRYLAEEQAPLAMHDGAERPETLQKDSREEREVREGEKRGGREEASDVPRACFGESGGGPPLPLRATAADGEGGRGRTRGAGEPRKEGRGGAAGGDGGAVGIEVRGVTPGVHDWTGRGVNGGGVGDDVAGRKYGTGMGREGEQRGWYGGQLDVSSREVVGRAGEKEEGSTEGEQEGGERSGEETARSDGGGVKAEWRGEKGDGG